MVDVSVIIPTYSVRDPLRDCLRSLLRQTMRRDRYEILVINNGGPGHSAAFLEPLISELGDNIRLVQAKGNLGYSGGCTLGAQEAAGKLLAFHNDDSVADPAWLALAWAAWQKQPDLGAVTCRIVDTSGPRVQHEGVRMVWPSGFFWQDGFSAVDHPDRQVLSQPGPPRDVSEPGSFPAGKEIPFLTGCIWATPRAVWDRLEGLSPVYRPGYYEDTDYILRCRQLGYRILLLPWVTCSHQGSLTLTYGSPRYWICFHRSRYLFLARNRLPYSLWEVCRAELSWWKNQRAEGHLAACWMSILAALPRLPRALLDRHRWTRGLRERFSR